MPSGASPKCDCGFPGLVHSLARTPKTNHLSTVLTCCVPISNIHTLTDFMASLAKFQSKPRYSTNPLISFDASIMPQSVWGILSMSFTCPHLMTLMTPLLVRTTSQNCSKSDPLSQVQLLLTAYASKAWAPRNHRRQQLSSRGRRPYRPDPACANLPVASSCSGWGNKITSEHNPFCITSEHTSRTHASWDWQGVGLGGVGQ